MNRFYLPASEWNAESPRLSESESHHAHDVLRLAVGDKITVFDGQGHESTARISAIENRQAVLSLGARTSSTPLPGSLVLAQAIPKGKTMEMIVQKAVELGAATIAPLLSDRTVVKLDSEEKTRKRSKWQEVALEACKQCGQNFLPEVLEPQSVASFLEKMPRRGLFLIASLQPDARKIKDVLALYVEEHGKQPGHLTIFIGPEGDFTPAELALAKTHGCIPVTLGPIVLRTETAALYCLSVLGHELFS
jgi:16S rRNA (uracil1498-N3)-methyltransferase